MPKSKEINSLIHYCYIIKNTINSKVYIGVTHKNIEKRLKEHFAASSIKNKKNKQAIHKAISKYGKDKFSIYLLNSYKNAEFAFSAEKNYIKQFKSTNNKYGYNQSLGGDCGPITLKYDRVTIINILEDFCNQIPLKEIAIKYNIKYHSVFDITRLRISNKHKLPIKLINKINKTKTLSKKKKRVTPEMINNIIIDFLQNYTIAQMSKKYKLCLNTVWNIIHRNTWKNVKIDDNINNQLKEKLSSKKYCSLT